MSPDNAIAIFGMGCFWCAESAFRNPETHALLPGIISLRVGYAGGSEPNPTYEHHLGYKEVIKLVYSPDEISYEALLDIFWKNIDPLDAQGQFSDRGFSYTSVIFYTTLLQQETALKSKQEIEKQFKDVFTEILPSTSFYEAEEYHQDYKTKNPVTYCYYRLGCGRDKRLKALWQNS